MKRPIRKISSPEKPRSETPEQMGAWKLVTNVSPPPYLNVLFAFEEHWNQVAGFRSGVVEGEYYETSAHDANLKIAGPPPKWWTPIPNVPHRRR